MAWAGEQTYRRCTHKSVTDNWVYSTPESEGSIPSLCIWARAGITLGEYCFCCIDTWNVPWAQGRARHVVGGLE